MKSARTIPALAGILLLALICTAQVPFMFNYQGKLVDGTNLVNASTTIVFRLFNIDSGGDPLYIETQDVVIVDSLYSTHIGESPDVGSLADAATNQPLFLELQIGDTTLSPREQVVSVLYALKAGGVITGGVTSAMLADYAVTGPKIAYSAVSNNQIAARAVLWEHLADQSIQSNKIDWQEMPPGLQDGDDDTVLASYKESGSFSSAPQVSGTDAIAQGSGNTVSGNYAVVSGGKNNRIGSGSQESVIAGGTGNIIRDGTWRGTIGGGWTNVIGSGATDSTIAGGRRNTIVAGAATVIGGGDGNAVSGLYATVSGGKDNEAIAIGATVSGGASNRASATGATIGGGGIALDGSLYGPNEARSSAATIGGGFGNTVETNALVATIAGGEFNRIRTAAHDATIGGGNQNVIHQGSQRATIAGGFQNVISNDAQQAVIAGGRENIIKENAEHSTVSGGENNKVGQGANYATVGGGGNNRIGDYSDYTMIGGGRSNTTANFCEYSMIPGGANNRIGPGADYAFAAGRRARADHSGTFVWADNRDWEFTSTAGDQFIVRAGGGIGLGTASPGSGTVTINGDLVITNSSNAFRGSIGPNGGAPFPRPAYDSGWVTIPGIGQHTTVVHGIGGNIDDYVVDMQMQTAGYGINTVFNGHDRYGLEHQGNWYEFLTTNSVELHCGQHHGWTNVRVRIWVYN
ncbi:MAG: hypothetical protein KJ626_04215 [Verrucomicrobia bacterium]|nr:hypothetical protein [Verrucomicrobiota bacterium]